ncbi:MAG: lytic murein transglycosylase [Gemmobacter sp.]|nr:lytic murein transglycosylase [Gemmobacter sp.]
MRLTIALILGLWATPVLAADCGGPFASWLDRLKTEAVAKGHAKAKVDAFFRTASVDKKVLSADRAQGVFRKNFTEFSRSLISKNRIDTAASKARTHRALFDRAEQDYGVSRGILLAFWAFETDFGTYQGDFNTLNALVTLAHDCRRPDLFRPHALAALELAEKGMLDPARTTGAWAGEIGMVQMLPADILERGVDGDGDGKVSLKTSVPDAILSGARVLRDLGWRRGEPWLQEVILPGNLDWSLTGIDKTRPGSDWAALGVKARNGRLAALPASILLPQGRKGPAFIVYPNFQVLFDWNKSFVYVTTAAYFATRIEGAPSYDAGKPDPGLDADQMKALQRKLQANGHDVGKIDGILGALTRIAVQSEQARMGLPADAWPTRALLDRL